MTGDIRLFLLSGTDGGVPRVSIDATLRTGDNFSCVSQSNLEDKTNTQIIIYIIYTYTGSTYKPSHKIRIQNVSDLHKGFVPETFTYPEIYVSWILPHSHLFITPHQSHIHFYNVSLQRYS